MSFGLLWLFALALTTDRVSAGPAIITQAPYLGPGRPRDRLWELERRDTTTTELSTCGYLDGNVDDPRTVQPGFDCRIDTAHGIWGFCPTTVIAATDCGLAAACKDSGTCTSICRFNSDSALTTFTCASSGTFTNYCSTALLTFGVDQTYGYLACGASPETQHYEITPTFTPSSSTTLSTSSKTSSASSKSSTSSTASTSPSSRTSSSIPLATSSSSSSSEAEASALVTPGSSGSSSGSNVGAIVGGVVGGLALVCGSAVAAIYIIKRNRSNAAGRTSDREPPQATESPLALSSFPAAQGLYEVESSNEAKYPSDHGAPHGYSYAVELPSNTHL